MCIQEMSPTPCQPHPDPCCPSSLLQEGCLASQTSCGWSVLLTRPVLPAREGFQPPGPTWGPTHSFLLLDTRPPHLCSHLGTASPPWGPPRQQPEWSSDCQTCHPPHLARGPAFLASDYRSPGPPGGLTAPHPRHHPGLCSLGGFCSPLATQRPPRPQGASSH